jgi:glycosyltransferase involved in cell wall biosynthesis
MILIDAIYINTGGGKVLLEYFIETLIKNQIEKKYYFLIDSRIDINLVDQLDKSNYIILTPTEKNRKDFYQSEINKYSSILCFANVPPPIKLSNKPVFIYFHNTLLLDYTSSNLPFINKLQFFLKRTYIKFKNNKNYRWIVQTSKIAEFLSTKLHIKNSKIDVLPIFNIEIFRNCNTNNKEYNNQFLYVADSSEQKNHNILLDAWELFSKSIPNNCVFLNLTLSAYSTRKLLDRIELMNNCGYNIINHGVCTREEIKKLYSKCNFLVYPSLAESFGLPLIEATSAGCKVISSHLPYVYQVIEPSVTFNPSDSKSLRNALLLTQSNTNIKSSKLLVENKINYLIKKLSNV